MKPIVSTLAAALVAATLAGCAVQPPPYQPPVQSGTRNQSGLLQYGSVQSIDTVRAQNQTTGGGALLGGAAGALLGHQVEHGNKRAAITVVGAVAGALIGNEIEKNQRGAKDFYRVAIRMDDGAVRAFDYQSLGDIRVGDRVRVENNQVFRY